MTDHINLRSIQLYIDILSASSDPANPCLAESMRRDAKNIALELINDLYDRSVLDITAHRDLFAQISIAYVGGDYRV